MVPLIETSRLILRQPQLTDAPTIQDLFPRWEIVQFLSTKVPWPYPENGALEFLRDRMLPDLEKGKLWAWAILLKAGPEHLIGLISLTGEGDENRAFWLGLPWQGQGIMSEACDAVTEFWFNGIGRDVLRVSKAVPNLASRRISEKQGAKLVVTEERNFVSGRWLAHIWELSREDWNRNRHGG